MSATGREPGSLGPKIPVEELDEMRLARIERSVLGALAEAPKVAPARRRSDWAWPAAFVACAAALVVVLLRSGTAAPQQPREVAFVTSEAPSQVHVARARIDVAAHSKVAIREHAANAVRVMLTDGKVHCDVEKYPGRPEFVVDAGEVNVTVVGTAFSVARSGKEVAVEVERGIVRVAGSGDEVRLEAGQRWATPGWTEPGTESPTVAVAKSDGEAARAASGSQTGSSEPVTSEPTATDTRDGAVAVAPRKPGKKPAETAKVVSPGTFSPFRSPTGLDPIMSAPSGSAEEVEHFYRSLSLARGDSSKSSYALYSLAHWQLYRMRNPRAALQSADLYERRFRRAAHAESMLWVRMAALCALELDSRCRAAAHSYMRRYPGGRFARQVKDVINRQR